MSILTLTSGTSRLVVTTEGGGLLEYTTEHKARQHHILRPSRGDLGDPLDRAMIIMAPWCNRISGGGFSFGNHFHALERNFPDVEHPLHGNALQANWSVVSRGVDRATLALHSVGPAGFEYRATIAYLLADKSVTMRLTVDNLSAEPMPFVIGLHPWFTTDAQTRLCFAASGVAQIDGSGPPPKIYPLAAVADRDFAASRLLPSSINDTFLGWTQEAVLSNADHEVTLSGFGLPMHLHVYSPSPDAGFCCLEPQTDVPDAFNAPTGPGTVLLSGQSMAIGSAISHTFA